MEKTRVTRHCGRCGRASHNDRSFDLSKAEHINKTKTETNKYWHCYKKEHPEMTFEEAEKRYYKEHYSQSLNAQNERHLKARHKERVKTIDDIYKSKSKQPCEGILQVGNKNNNCANITYDIARSIYNSYHAKFNAWNKEHGEHVHVISVALHNDETSIHFHERTVYDYMTEDGLKLEQKKALELAGVPLPEPTQKEGRFNNRKMTFDAMMRGFWIEACKEHGIDVIEEPAPTRRHQNKEEYINSQIQSKEKLLDEIIQKLQWLDDKKNEDIQTLKNAIAEYTEQATDYFNRMVRLMRDLQYANEAVGVWDVLKEKYPKQYEQMKSLYADCYDINTETLDKGHSPVLDEVFNDIEHVPSDLFDELSVDDYYPVKSKTSNDTPEVTI